MVKIWKWQKLLNSVPLIKKILVNQIYVRNWSFSLTFMVLQWMKTNFKSRQFSRFLPRSKCAIQVEIWKWLKLLNSVPIIKKTLVNQVDIRVQVFSWWMGRNSEVLVIFKFRNEAHTRTSAEIFKIDQFWSLSSFTVQLRKSFKMIKFECKHGLQVFSGWMEQN